MAQPASRPKQPYGYGALPTSARPYAWSANDYDATGQPRAYTPASSGPAQSIPAADAARLGLTAQGASRASQPVRLPNGQVTTQGDIDRYYGALADEDRARFDVGTKFGYDQLSSVDRQRRAQVDQAKAELDQRRREHADTFGLDTRKFEESQRQFGVTTGVDLLRTGAQMRGPASWIQGDMYAQGATGLSPYLASLRTGQPVQYGGGTGTQGNPVPLTVGTLANAMSGGQAGTSPPVPSAGGPAAAGASTAAPGASGAPASPGMPPGPAGLDAYGRPRLSPEAQAAVDATATVYERGIANQPLGFLENMTKDQREAFGSQSDYLGRNVRSEEAYYRRSRPGQRSGALA